MATVFSTATLGLSVDSKQLNKELASAEKSTSKHLENMEYSAEAFNARWKDLTSGIKDTKRIISGILVSQGFYALSNAMVTAGAAALDFSSSIEQARVSLEYFVDAAVGTEDAAAQVSAYLREVNNFAARTPFSTSDVLTLSKYMQAVGVSIGQTQSVLSVITDAAAATGATAENLQRITFALGQMITKGRIANEEIRQLANANIPVYAILQEEMGLTGEQISNIGNYWIDANDAVVAILNGLTKRYAGASDRIAETLGGMTDTIVDDAKIIADSAFGDIYTGITSAAGSLRDTLDYWRDAVTEHGSMGLFNTILLDIDPSGKFGNQVLAIIGNIRQLQAAFSTLKAAATPLLGVLGDSFYASISIGTIALTALSKTATGVIEIMNKLGLTTGSTGEAIASLYIAYKSAQFVSILGQAMASAGISAVSAANSLYAILPAALSANTGVKILTAGMAGLVSVLMTAVGVYSMLASLNNSFAGLETNKNGGLADDYQSEYDKYKAAMDEYNAKIAAQQEKYQQSYTEMANGSSIKTDADKDDSSSASSGSSKDKNWQASFDEVYTIPEDDDTGDYQDAVLDDLADLLLAAKKFEFPKYDSLDLELPEFDWSKVYDGSVWDGLSDDIAGKSFWKAFLPTAIIGGVYGLGKAFAKQQKENSKVIKEALGGGKATATGTNFKTTDDAAKAYAKQAADLNSKLGMLDDTATETERLIKNMTSFEGGTGSSALLEAQAKVLRDQYTAIKALRDSVNENAAIAGKSLITITNEQRIERTLLDADLLRISTRLNALHHAFNTGTQTVAEQQATLKTIAKLNREQSRLLGARSDASIANATATQLADRLSDVGAKLVEQTTNLFTGEYKDRVGKKRLYDADGIKHFAATVDEFSKLSTQYKKLYANTAAAQDTLGTRLVSIFDTLKGDLADTAKSLSEAVDAYNQAVLVADTATRANSGAGFYAEVEGAFKKFINDETAMVDVAKRLSVLDPVNMQAIAERNETLAKQRADDAAARAKEAAAQREAQIAQQKKAAAEQKKIRETAEKINANQRFINNIDDATLSINNRYVEDIAGAAVDELVDLTDRLRNAEDWLHDDLADIARVSKKLDFLSKCAVKDSAKIAELKEELVNLRTDAALQATQRDELLEKIGTIKTPEKTLATVVTPVKYAKSIDDAYEAVIRALNKELPELPGMVESTARALQEFNDSLSPVTVRALKAIGADGDALLLTGTKALYAAKGLDIFGGTLQHTVAEVLVSSGNFARQLSKVTSEYVEDIAARGVVLEKYFGAAASVELRAKDVSVYGSGHAMRPGTQTIIQYDFAAKNMAKLVSGVADTISFDIKTSTQSVTDNLLKLAENVTDNVYKIDSRALAAIGREKWQYQFGAQDYAFGSNGNMLLGLGNADYDFSSVSSHFMENFWNKMIQTANNSAISAAEKSDIGGKVFSDKMFNAFRKLMNDMTLTWEDYDRLIIAPLFADSTSGIDFTDMSKAMNMFVVSFTQDTLKAMDFPHLEANYRKYAELFGLIADNKNVSNFLTTFVKVADDTTDAFSAIDFAPALRNYYKATRSVNRWANSILGTTGERFTRGFTTHALRDTLDMAVNSYTSALLQGVSADEAARSISATFKGISDMLDDALAGTADSDVVVKYLGEAVAKNTSKYYNDILLLQKVLEKLIKAPSLVSKLPALVTSTMSQMQRLTTAAAAGTEVTARDMSNIVSTYEQMADALRLNSDALAIRTGHELAAIQRFVAESGGRAVLKPEQLSKIVMPIEVATVKDSLELSAGVIARGLGDGTLKASKVAAERITELMSGLDLSRAATDYLQAIDTRISEYARTIIADLETTGMPKTTANGTWMPSIVQASFMDKDSSKLLSTFITAGHEQNVANLRYMQNILNKDGTLSDVAKVWRNITVDMLDSGITLEELWARIRKEFGTGNALTGWNATGVTGFDYQVMLGNRMPTDLFVPIDDIMHQFTQTVQSVTGVTKRFRLSDAFEIINGAIEDAAHLADNDVVMAQAISKALDDGTVKQILAYTDQVGELTSGAVVPVLKQAGVAYRTANGIVKEAVEEAASEAPKIADEAAKAALEAGRTIADATTNAAKATVETASEAASAADDFARTVKKMSFRDAFDGASTRFAANLDDALNTLRSKFTGFANRIKQGPFQFAAEKASFKPLSIDDALSALRKAAADADDIYEQMAKAFAEGGPSAADAVAKSADDILKAYEAAGNNMYRTLVTNMAESIKGVDTSVNLFDYLKSIDTNSEYIALVYDKASRQFKTLGDTLKLSGSDLLTKLSMYASDNSTAVKLVNNAVDSIVNGAKGDALADAIQSISKAIDASTISASKELTDSFADLTKAIKNGDDITDAAKAFGALFNTTAKNASTQVGEAFDALNDLYKTGKMTPEALDNFVKTFQKQFGNYVTVMNAASESTEYAGKTAAKAMGSAADDITGGIGSITKRIMTASIGTFSALDVIGVGVDSIVEVINTNKLQENFGELVNGVVSDNTRAMFTKAGIDLSDTLGDTVYKGISEALSQSIMITLFANGIGSAASAALTAIGVAAGPVGWIAAAAAAAAGVGASMFVNATGGNTDAYKHYNEYAAATETGKYIDYDTLVEQLKEAGYSVDAATAAADEANEVAHKQLQHDVLKNLNSGNMWEAGKVTEALYGTSGTSNNSTNETLRIAAALGSINIASSSRTEDYGDGAAITYQDLVVTQKDAGKQLVKIRELLGDSNLKLGDAVTLNGETYRYVVTAGGGKIGYDSSNLSVMSDALNMIGTQGYSTGSVAESVLSVINNSKELSAEFDKQYGNWREAINIMDEYLAVYNEAFDTDYTRSMLDEYQGATAQFLQQMVDTYETQSKLWSSELAQRTITDSTNRNLLNGNTSTMITTDTGVVITQAIKDGLSTIGLDLSSGSYAVDTALTGKIQQDYLTLSTNYEALRDNLAGITLDTSGITASLNGTTFDISKLTVSASDAEILAQAGIQVNSNGTITFMNALNDGTTGSTRDITLDRDQFSQEILDKFAKLDMTIDFKAGELDFGSFDSIKKQMSSALFAMSNDVSNELSEPMRKAISKIGYVTEDGLLQITNKAILSGKSSMSSILDSMDWYSVSDTVKSQLYNIAALIDSEGGSVQDNIIEWANGIVVPSPFKSLDDIPENLRAQYEKIGITFQESAYGLMMVIGQTGDKLNNGISLISKDKWMELDESVRTALETIGVTATESGNDMMIDLNGVFDGGIGNIVSLFVNQPDVWSQIPDSVRATLEEAGIVTQDQLIEIQTTLSGGLVDITNGWITAWNSLPPATRESLSQAGIDVTTGFAQIEQYVGDADVGTMLDDKVVCYFDDLPKDIQDSMNKSGENLRGSKILLSTATDTAVGDMLGVLQSTTQNVSTEAENWGKTMADAYKEALLYAERMSNIKVSSSWTNNSGKTGVATVESKGDGKYIVRVNDKKYTIDNASSSSEAVKLVKDKYGVAITSYSAAANGSNSATGLTLTGELGREMAILPDGSVTMLGANGAQLLDLPAGTRVINNDDTEDIMHYTGRIDSVPKLASGNVSVVDYMNTDPETAADNRAALIIAGGTNDTQTLMEYIGSALELLGDRLEYAPLIEAISEVSATITDSVDSVCKQLEQGLATLDSMYAFTAEANNAYKAAVDKKVEEQEPYVDAATGLINQVAQTIAKAQYDVANASTAAERAAAHKAAEDARALLGYSGGAYGDENIGGNQTIVDIVNNKVAEILKHLTGSASGSVVSGDSLYRAGEANRREAILPLERPEIMRYVGASIASYMPVETQELSAAIGMRDAGIATSTAAHSTADDTEIVVRKVLEAVLPITTQQTVPSNNYNIGTLIADERSLRALKRQLNLLDAADRR